MVNCIESLLDQDRSARDLAHAYMISMNFLQTLIAFIGALGTLIVIHELGHYLVARWCGVKVLRFSVGMGKIIFHAALALIRPNG